MHKHELKKFDIRTLKRNIDKGIITKSEYENFLKSLDDEEGNYDLAPLVAEELENLQENTPVEKLESASTNPHTPSDTDFQTEEATTVNQDIPTEDATQN